MGEIEELVQLIQAGERGRLMELWERVRRFAAKRANMIVGAAGGRAEYEDLMQAAFLALLAAVDAYDTSRGFRFLSYFGNHLKTAFAEATGYRTEKKQRDPLNRAVSLDQPLDDTDGDTVGDLIADPSDPIADAEERMFREWLSERIRKAVETLPLDQQEVVRLRFYQGQSMEQINAALDGDRLAARRLHDRALRALRHSMYIRDLKQYVEGHTNYYRKVGAKSGRSPVEEEVVRRETLLALDWEKLMEWDC